MYPEESVEELDSVQTAGALCAGQLEMVRDLIRESDRDTREYIRSGIDDLRYFIDTLESLVWRRRPDHESAVLWMADAHEHLVKIGGYLRCDPRQEIGKELEELRTAARMIRESALPLSVEEMERQYHVGVDLATEADRTSLATALGARVEFAVKVPGSVGSGVYDGSGGEE